MQRIRLTGFVTMAVLALTATLASTAAAKPEFLDNVKGNTFTGKGGAGTIEVLGGGLKVACTETSLTGEVTGNEEGVIKDINFKGCTALGFKANSLGDAEGTILTGAIPFKLCYINEAKMEAGIYLEKINIHDEVPALVGTLLDLTGSMIGRIVKANSLQSTIEVQFEQTAAGDQNPVTCILLKKNSKLRCFRAKTQNTKKTNPLP